MKWYIFESYLVMENFKSKKRIRKHKIKVNIRLDPVWVTHLCGVGDVAPSHPKA